MSLIHNISKVIFCLLLWSCFETVWSWRNSRVCLSFRRSKGSDADPRQRCCRLRWLFESDRCEWFLWTCVMAELECWQTMIWLTAASLCVCLSAESHLSKPRRRAHFLPASRSHVREADWGETRVRNVCMCFLSRFITLIIQSSCPMRETHRDLVVRPSALLYQITVWLCANCEH